jgi:glycosyltransferase involved in cell wall biosynthesis
VAPGLPGDAAAGRSLSGGHPYVLAVGTIEPRKDHPTLVEAFASLRSAHPELRLVIAGPDGWGVEAYDDAVRRTGTSSAIVRLGFVSEQTKADLLAGASVFAYPSRYEGFGLPPLEAAAAGVPVVATDAGAIPEVMADGASIVAVGDAAALAAALDQALTDDDLRRRLVAAGRVRVQRHGWPEAVARLVELYGRLAGA